MGAKSTSSFGVDITTKGSSQRQHQDEIFQFIDAVSEDQSFDVVQVAVNDDPELKAACEANGNDFPDYKAGLVMWFEDMKPEQATAIVAAFEKKYS